MVRWKKGAVLHRASREAEGEGNEFGFFLACRTQKGGVGWGMVLSKPLGVTCVNWIAPYPKPYPKASGKSLSSGQHKHSS